MNRTHKEEEKDQLICYECKKSGHMKVECPNLKKSLERKKHKNFVATWSDEDTSDDEDYVANLCLMAIEDDQMVTSNSSISIDYTFDELQEAYNELVLVFLVCEESMLKNQKTISKLNVENDSLYNEELESKIQELQVKLNDFEKKNKDLHYLLSRAHDDHQKKIDDLKASFNKVGAKIDNGESSKPTMLKETLMGISIKVPKDHIIKKKVRSIWVPKRLIANKEYDLLPKWIPQGTRLLGANTYGPKRVWVPKIA
ncbi:hypothetical protein GQ457_09G026810 [Hibiscus cannabinus]